MLCTQTHYYDDVTWSVYEWKPADANMPTILGVSRMAHFRSKSKQVSMFWSKKHKSWKLWPHIRSFFYLFPPCAVVMMKWKVDGTDWTESFVGIGKSQLAAMQKWNLSRRAERLNWANWNRKRLFNISGSNLNKKDLLSMFREMELIGIKNDWYLVELNVSSTWEVLSNITWNWTNLR